MTLIGTEPYDMMIRRSSSESPSEYLSKSIPAKILYVTSNHSVDCGMNISINQVWEVTACRALGDSSGNLAVIGTSAAKATANFSLWLNPSTNVVEFIFGDGGAATAKVTTSAYNVSQIHTYRMKLSTAEAWIDGNYIGKATNPQTSISTSNAKKIVFYGCWRGSSMNSYFKGGIGEVKIWENDVLVRDYIPACSYTISTNYYEVVSNSITYFTGCQPGFSIDFAIDVEATSTYNVFDLKFANLLGEYSIDWGDGTSLVSSDTDGWNLNLPMTTLYGSSRTHTYAVPGIYTIQVKIPCGNMVMTLASTTCIIKRLLRFHPKFIPMNFINSARDINQKLLPDSLIIGTDAFHNCSGLLLTDLPPSLMSIGLNAFMNCSSLSSMHAPLNLNLIYQSAFQNCTNLDFINKNLEEIQYIGPYAFRDCTSLDIRSIASGCEISQYAFIRCSSLKDVTLNLDARAGNYSFQGAGLSSLQIFFEQEPQILGVGSFKSCSSLKDVTFHYSGLSSTSFDMPSSCFESCTSLSSVLGLEPFRKIQKAAFKGDASLKTLTLGSHCQYIQAEAFENTGLKEVHFAGGYPTLARSIDATAFNGCTSLTDIYVPWSEGAVANAPWRSDKCDYPL